MKLYHFLLILPALLAACTGRVEPTATMIPTIPPMIARPQPEIHAQGGIPIPPILLNSGYAELYFGDRKIQGEAFVVLTVHVNFNEQGQAASADILLSEVWSNNFAQFQEQLDAGSGLMKIVALQELILVEALVEYDDGTTLAIPRTVLTPGEHQFDTGIVRVYPFTMQDGYPQRGSVGTPL